MLSYYGRMYFLTPITASYFIDNGGKLTLSLLILLWKSQYNKVKTVINKE